MKATPRKATDLSARNNTPTAQEAVLTRDAGAALLIKTKSILRYRLPGSELVESF